MTKRSVLLIGLRFLFGKPDSANRSDLARRAVRGALLSVAISLVPLIVVMQVSSGMIRGITDRYIELGTYHLQLRSQQATSLADLTTQLGSLPGVRAAWPETRSAGVVFASGRQEGCMIRAVDAGYLLDETTQKYLELRDGSYGMEKAVHAVIGSALADKLGVGVGEAINLITLRGGSGNTTPRISIFIVSGIVSAGYRELDANWLFIPYQSAARLLDPSTSDSFIGIKTDDPYAPLDSVRAAVLASQKPGARVFAWHELERSLIASLANTQMMLMLIMAITVLVAAVNVASALSTLALERGREIAILKCIGAHKTDIQMIFSMAGAILGALGSLIGSCFGLLLSLHINSVIVWIERLLNWGRRLVHRPGTAPTEDLIRLLEPSYYLETIPVNISFGSIAIVLVTTILVSFLSAYFPARRAGRLVPQEIFRKHG